MIVTEAASAKVNLFLHVGERRTDGFHPLQSLAVFTGAGDALRAEAAAQLSLALDGPFAAGLRAEDDNLVLRAARALGQGGAKLALTKNLPVASGIGDGSGGGTGGGPYRPGSGVSPPRLLKEVRAQYSDQARRANLEGSVELEIVIRRDGSVGDIKVLRGLGMGLNEQAIQAVRQWKFAPSTLKGTPVDVIVEVSVEFRLR